MSWLAFDEDERRDAERVAMLEDAAEDAEPAEAIALLTDADELRAKWGKPRQRFATVAEIIEALQAVARDAGEVDTTDAEALTGLGLLAQQAGLALEGFAMDLDEAREEET